MTLTAAYDQARRLAHTDEAKRYGAFEAMRHTNWIPQAETMRLSSRESEVIRLWRKAGAHDVVFNHLLEALGPALRVQAQRRSGRTVKPKTSPARRPN
jgi:hypothetical protein